MASGLFPRGFDPGVAMTAGMQSVSSTGTGMITWNCCPEIPICSCIYQPMRGSRARRIVVLRRRASALVAAAQACKNLAAHFKT